MISNGDGETAHCILKGALMPAWLALVETLVVSESLC
jgi:hypothetical protein